MSYRLHPDDLSPDGLRKHIRLEMKRRRHGVAGPAGGIDHLLDYGGTWQDIMDVLSPDHLASLDFMDLIRLTRSGGELDRYASPEEVRRIVETVGGRKNFGTAEVRATGRIVPKGGRPPAEWTEELWFACFRRILDEGMFGTKAELQRFITDWLAGLNIHPSVSTLKAKTGEFWSRAGLGENAR